MSNTDYVSNFTNEYAIHKLQALTWRTQSSLVRRFVWVSRGVGFCPKILKTMTLAKIGEVELFAVCSSG